MSFQWNVFQDLKIADNMIEANRANRTASKARREAFASKESVEKLVLIVRAMWELLHQHTELTEVDLVRKVKELDLSDGIRDAKLKSNAAPSRCPNCGNKVHPSRLKCQFCGCESIDQDVFEKV